MPNLTCSYCGKLFYLNQKDYHKTIKSLDNFCSVDCLINFIKSYVPREVKVKYWITRPMLVGDLIYDATLKMFFRSKYELLVYKLLKVNNIGAEYESYTLKEGRKSYTPDFYIKDKDLFLEVKGVWQGGSKKKVEHWAKKINLVLVPWYLYREISKRS